MSSRNSKLGTRNEQRAFGALLIGDELLTGKRVDKHLPKLIELLDARGLELAWAAYVGDDPVRLEPALSRSLAGDDVVFCFGGIGATPDDRTRQCAAAAAGVALATHPEGRAILEEKFGERAYPHRIRMVEWPVGAEPIPNPVNQVPGFSLEHHHFLPGFPSMAWPMVTWVLDQRYAHWHDPARCSEFLIEALDTPESELIEIMDAVMRMYPRVRVACLPNASGRQAVEFGLRGPHPDAAAAYAELARALTADGIAVVEVAPPQSEATT